MLVYRDISFEDISLIKGLWERNRYYHQNISISFGDLYEDLLFEDRMMGFAAFDQDKIKITIAEDSMKIGLLGYCISVIEDTCGEVQTLYVLEEARGRGIGKVLVQDHLQWFKKNGCVAVKLSVSCENENTIAFYEALGFRSNTIEMWLMDQES